MTYIKIKDSALKLFSQRGFEGTTIKDIAAASGLKPSSIYSHITTKEELFITIWNECIQNMFLSIADLKKKVENGMLSNPKEILYLYYVQVTGHFIKHSHAYLFLKQAVLFTKDTGVLNKIEMKHPLNNDIVLKYFSKFFDTLQEAHLIAKNNSLELSHYYLGVIISYLEQCLVYNIVLPDNYMDSQWDIFWNGLSK